MKKIALFIAVLMMTASSSLAEYNKSRKKPVVFAHYMTWFSNIETSGYWTFWKWDQKGHERNPERRFPDGRKDVASLHYPLIGAYDTKDDAVVEYHILLAKIAGIDGFMVNWYGFRNEYGKARHEDLGFKKLIAMANKLDFKVSINFDDKCMFPPYTRANTREEAVKLAKQSVKEIVEKYAGQKSFFRWTNRPVLSNFGWGPPMFSSEDAVSFSPEEWRHILDKHRTNILFIGNHQWHWTEDLNGAGFLKVSESIYPWVAGDPGPRLAFYEQSKQAVAENKIEFISGQACPGFDNWGTWGWGGGRTIIDRKDGEVYKQTWKESIAAGAKWIQLITWNDFAEGTTIEPTRDYGYQYLELTADLIADLEKKKPDYRALRLPKQLYDARKIIGKLQNKNIGLIQDRKQLSDELDAIVAIIVARHYKQAGKRLDKLTKQLTVYKKDLLDPPGVEVLLTPHHVTAYAQSSTEFTIQIKNPTSKKIKGSFKLDSNRRIPKTWFGKMNKQFELAPNQTITQKVKLTLPKEVRTQDVLLEAIYRVNRKNIRSPLCNVAIKPVRYHIDLGKHHILNAKQSNKIAVTIVSDHQFSESGWISLDTPQDWNVSPSSIHYQLKPKDRFECEFDVVPGKQGVEDIIAVVQRRNKGTETVSQTFGVLGDQSVLVFENDCDNDGNDDVVIGNDRIEIQVAPSFGGRIMQLINRQSGNNQLYVNHSGVEKTAGKKTIDWTEYGGINDTAPTVWPGKVWNNKWNWQVEKIEYGKVLKMWVDADAIKVTRWLILKKGSAVVEARYRMKNSGKEKKTVYWANHPDFAPGPSERATSNHVLIVPTATGLVEKAFTASMVKDHYKPSQGWCLAFDKKSGEYVTQTFSAGAVKTIGCWQGKTFFTMELMKKKRTLFPGETWQFTIGYEIGTGDWKKKYNY